MKAALIKHDRFNDPFGNLVEMKLWSVPVTDYTPFGVKYSLAYILNGERVVGYDNERGKGDHRHVGDVEEVYKFTTLRMLLDDFEADTERL